MSRTLRKLTIPADTTLVYGNWSTSIRKSLTKSVMDEITGNEFTGTFSDLKPGRYDYRVYGEDYATPSRVLTVLPPPALLSLTAEQARPAYLYYRPAPGSDGKELRGLKQPFEEIDISNFGSDVSRLEVPAGTDVRLLALPNEVLREDGVEIKPAKPGDKVPFKDLRVTPWYQLTDKALATLRTGKVPANIVDKLTAWREQFGLEISDRTLSALQEAKAPDAVLDKIKSLKDKAFDRPTLVSLLDRLSPAERDKFQDTVLQHASKEPKFEHDHLVAELDKLLSPEEKAKYEDTLLKQTSLGDMIAVSFPDVRQDINFSLVFFDQYGVKGSRAIQIKAKEDQPPELNEVMPDVVRKTKDGYIVSVLARVPFRGRVKDDTGLSGLRYAYTLSKIESGPRINVRALFMYAAVPGLAATRCSPVLTAAFYINAQSEGLRPPDTETVGDTVRLPNLPLYLRAVNDKDRVLRDGRREYLPQDTVKELLARKQKLPFRQLLTDLTLKPDPWLNEETMNPGTWKGGNSRPGVRLRPLEPQAQVAGSARHPAALQNAAVGRGGRYRPRQRRRQGRQDAPAAPQPQQGEVHVPRRLRERAADGDRQGRGRAAHQVRGSVQPGAGGRGQADPRDARPGQRGDQGREHGRRGQPHRYGGPGAGQAAAEGQGSVGRLRPHPAGDADQPGQRGPP